MKSISSSSKQILHNPFVLYFVLAIALGDLLYLSVAGNFMFVAIFILIGFLASFFSKNMVVILVIAMAATSIIQFGSAASFSEGLKGEDDEEDEGFAEGIEEEEEEGFADSPETEKPATDTKPATETAKPATDTETVAKIVKKQEDLVEKVKKLEPMLKQVETFIDGLNKFSEYKS